MLKKSFNRMSFICEHALAGFLLSVRLSGGWQNRCCRLAEEPHQSLDVLGSCCQEELLLNELQSPQAQAAQTDLILEFREHFTNHPAGNSSHSPQRALRPNPVRTVLAKRISPYDAASFNDPDARKGRKNRE